MSENTQKVNKEVDGNILWEADPNCDCEIEVLWSGIRCSKCGGWCCL